MNAALRRVTANIIGPGQSAWTTNLPKLAAIVLHSPSPFITTQLKGWYSFLRTKAATAFIAS